MQTQRLDVSNSTSFSRSIEMRTYAGSLMPVRAVDTRALSRDADWRAEQFADLSRLAKGVSWALSIEGGAALSLYVIWHLWHVWR